MLFQTQMLGASQPPSWQTTYAWINLAPETLPQFRVSFGPQLSVSR
jgi:hypothetical protein